MGVGHLFGRRSRGPVTVPGARVLASAVDEDGHGWAATPGSLVLVHEDAAAGVRVPWERVRGADWDSVTSTLKVTELGEWGRGRPVHTGRFTEAGALLEVVRERVTASVVWQQHVAVPGTGAGLLVMVRQGLTGDRERHWLVELDEGLDPDDPTVRTAADTALAQARSLLT